METYSQLYLKDTFTNKNIPFLFNKNIIEYDMRNAGLSLIQEYSLLPKKEIEKLSKMHKKNRVVEIGKIQRKNDKFKENMSVAFVTARKDFFEKNHIQDQDVIAIKKDAIFLNKVCDVTKIGDFIEFREKNSYSSFIQINKLEMYYNPEKLDIKGISDSLVELHNDFMIKFLKSFFNKMETEEPEKCIAFVRRFIDKYKERSLAVEYYREFNFQSMYRTVDNELYEEFWEDEKNRLDISYNFINILVNLIQIPL